MIDSPSRSIHCHLVSPWYKPWLTPRRDVRINAFPKRENAKEREPWWFSRSRDSWNWYHSTEEHWKKEWFKDEPRFIVNLSLQHKLVKFFASKGRPKTLAFRRSEEFTTDLPVYRKYEQANSSTHRHLREYLRRDARCIIRWCTPMTHFTWQLWQLDAHGALTPILRNIFTPLLLSARIIN